MSQNKMADGKKLDAIIRLIDTDALAQADQGRFDASVRKAETELPSIQRHVEVCHHS